MIVLVPALHWLLLIISESPLSVYMMHVYQQISRWHKTQLLKVILSSCHVLITNSRESTRAFNILYVHALQACESQMLTKAWNFLLDHKDLLRSGLIEMVH